MRRGSGQSLPWLVVILLWGRVGLSDASDDRLRGVVGQTLGLQPPMYRPLQSNPSTLPGIVVCVLFRETVSHDSLDLVFLLRRPSRGVADGS